MESPPRARGRADHAVPRALDAEITPSCAGKSHSWLRMLSSSRNHPRVRGEENGWTTGLNHANRITPACAGKSTCPSRSGRSFWNHPRVREEEHLSRTRARVLGESPPRARGRANARRIRIPVSRITPACAGKSPADPRCRAQPRNHPRVRGEEWSSHESAIAELESPPRARGRVTVWSMVTQDEGITPACAGKSLRLPRLAGLVGNHPRVRGEEPIASSRATISPESPPRARGRTLKANSTTPATRNHPRVRGEESPLAAPHSLASESPPRARGRVIADDDPWSTPRITPACAGKRLTRRHRRRSFTESPPRARGRGLELRNQFTPVGITPACAGKSCCMDGFSPVSSESPPRARGRAGSHRTGQRHQWNHPRVRGEECEPVGADAALPGITPACAGKSIDMPGSQ